jgi:uncharacterized protein
MKIAAVNRIVTFLTKSFVAKIVIGILVLFSGYSLFNFLAGRGPSDIFVKVDWQTLGAFDYVTGQSTGELPKLDGHNVRIPGFMVPLEDNQNEVTEFLLVPTPQACIHVPPPPPNQMVLVKMKDKPAAIPSGPIWVYGELNLKSKRHAYGESSFSMVGFRIEEYTSK